MVIRGARSRKSSDGTELMRAEPWRKTICYHYRAYMVEFSPLSHTEAPPYRYRVRVVSYPNSVPLGQQLGIDWCDRQPSFKVAKFFFLKAVGKITREA